MELLWIIFITFLAVTAAYYAGGYLDRRTRTRQAEEDHRRRAEYLARTAEFARGFAGLLVQRGLAREESVFEIACMLGKYLEKYSDESYTSGEWEQLKEQLRMSSDTPQEKNQP